ncbi:MAG: cold-shock protein [Succinivibrionaceae bacterium]|nr:cold-shock protein [Ruminobacter sp.]MDY5779941.1 cold-shock protein [Succinivibrionaceae bacterium]MEE1340401.1 cold-shock protein [Succinivibrionaceae bacterium]
MTIGTVKWFNNSKGFGFITTKDTNEDIFVHYSSIAMNGYKTLKTNQEVSFDLEKGEKGYHAINIVALNKDDENKKAA